MSFVLLLLGVVTTAAGVAMIGFGIPINEFSLGNTLIVSGTTLLSGGLIVIALSSAVRHLARIAAILNRGGASAPYVGRPMDEPGSHGRPGPTRAAPPSVPPRPDPAPAEPRLAATNEDSDQSAFRSPSAFVPPRGGLPPVESEESAPRAAERPAPAAASERKGWFASRRAAEAGARPRPSAAEARTKSSFDDAWPVDARAQRIAEESAERAAEDRASEAPAPRSNGDASHHEIASSDEPGRPDAPVTVLKSGVVDGMAYTLYTDGSIEAELAQGVVRFGSIEELRNHLEKGA